MRNAILFLSTSAFFAFGFVFFYEDTSGLIRKKYAQYISTYNRAKIDILFSQPSYSRGDTAFFRLYYLNASDLSFKKGIEVIHLNIFDNEGKEILASELLVRDGFSKANLVFPRQLPPGAYLIIAHSDWMKNMDESLYFKREIMLTDRKKLKVVTENDNKFIEIYPEGGSLIEEVENNVLFKLKNSNSNSELIIKNSLGDIIATTPLDAHGMAEIKVRPKNGEKYSVEYLSNKNLVAKSLLPNVKKEGLSLQVLMTDNFRPTNLVVRTKGIDLNNKYSVVMINASGIVFVIPLVFGIDDYEKSIPLSKNLPRGISQICILDNDLKVQAERLIFVGIEDELSIDFEMSDFYRTREEVDVRVSIQDQDKIPLSAKFSVRVFNSSIFDSSDENIVTNLIFSSDLPFARELNNMKSVEWLNRHLITQKCNWIDFESILLNSRPLFKPTSYQVLSGVAYNSQSTPVQDSTLITFFLKNEILGYEGYANQSGRFQVPLQYSLFGAQDIFYSASFNGRDINDITIKLDKDSSCNFQARTAVEIEELDVYANYFHSKTVIDNSYGFYSGKTTFNNLKANPNDPFEEELGGADITVNLKDYVVFPTMSELIREVVRSVEHRKIKGKDIIRVYTTQKRPNNSSQPLYIIDGILTKNTDYFLKLNPEDVLTLKVIKDSNKLTRFGSLGNNGIIMVETRTRYWGKSHEEKSFYYTGFSDTITTKVINSYPANIPDLRASLYWNPNLMTNDVGESHFNFRISDHTGDFVIQIQGITQDGIPFFKQKNFSVVFKNHQK